MPLGGSTEQLGSHKGYGYGMFCEIFCSILSQGPLVTTVVEASKKNGYGFAGIAKAIGLEPNIALLANVGTMIASELVNDNPINP